MGVKEYVSIVLSFSHKYVYSIYIT